MSKHCHKCGMEIPDNARICPYCREEQYWDDDQMKWSIIGILIAAVVSGIILILLVTCHH